ncbi:MAG: serine hydrolase [Pseudomonadota bacterium]
MKRLWKPAVITLLLVIGATLWVFGDKIQRLRWATSLFSGAEQYEQFSSIPELLPTSKLEPAAEPFIWPEGKMISLPDTFDHSGRAIRVAEFLAETDTSALLLIKDGEIRSENYYLTGGKDVQWISFSVAKSFISALVGIAVSEGHIKSIEEPASAYLPELAGSGYEGVRIKDILQMSSGASWNEDYSDFDSDINRMGRVFALGGSLDEFITTLSRDFDPGTYNRYNSTDTQVLGRLLVATTGRSISEYMTEKLWHPIGAEAPGYWILDNYGMEMAFAGYNATARDYAKLGFLYLNDGNWFGQQVIDAEWVRASLTADAPHLEPGDNPASNNVFGYGFQWWLFDGDDEDYSAIGVYNQFIYVNPAERVVIVKLSANSDYGMTQDESSYREEETLSLFRELLGTVERDDG